MSLVTIPPSLLALADKVIEGGCLSLLLRLLSKITQYIEQIAESISRDILLLLDGLRVPPGNRLEALRGNRVGQWSTRINDQWRICFRWKDNDAWDVEIVDYH
jgi:proteic killer suppression protein